MDENELVDESKFIYRRIAPQYYDASLAISVQREAFRPTSNDLDELSHTALNGSSRRGGKAAART